MIAPAKENDRVFLVIRADGLTDQRADWIMPLRRQCYPVSELYLPTVTDLPALMYGLEKTVATIGWLWDINIVDQDNVEGYKAEARAIQAAVQASGQPIERPTDAHVKRYSHLELHYGSVLTEGLLTEEQLGRALQRIRGDRENAVDVYAAIVMALMPRPGDFRFYGHPPQALVDIIQRFRGVYSRRFKQVTQFGIGTGVNHTRHQNDSDDINTILASWDHEAPIDGTDEDGLWRALTIGTLRDLSERRKRATLFLLHDRLTAARPGDPMPETLGAL